MNKEKKTCIDCLHCKVSAAKTKKGRLCFCALSKNQLRYQEVYWLTKKKLCKKFNDMTIIEPKRRPLLKKKA